MTKKPEPKCEVCQRKPETGRFGDCSVVECPNRRPLTASAPVLRDGPTPNHIPQEEG